MKNLKNFIKRIFYRVLSIINKGTILSNDNLISQKEFFDSDIITIGLVVSSFDKGGLEQAVFNLYEGFWKKGIKAYVLCQTNNIGHFSNKLYSPEHLLIFNNNEKKFVDFCRNHRISWLHYHFNTFMIEKIRVLGIKTIYTIHSIYSWLSDYEIIKRAELINTADYVVAVSKFTKDYYCIRTKTPSSKVSIIPIGINTKELGENNLDDQYTRKSLGFSENDTVLGFIASFHEVKHQMNMVGAMERIIKIKPHTNLIFLGNILQNHYYKKVKNFW
jgi:glycosyltransferase involved in cell wall biosynthesis